MERQSGVLNLSTYADERAEIVLESRRTGPDLGAVRARLLADQPLNEGDRRLAALGLELLAGPLSRLAAARLRQEGLRERNRLIRELAAKFYAGRPRARARQLLADANRYATTSWPRDRACVLCPERLRGKPEALLWAAFKTHPVFPRERMLKSILRDPMCNF